MRIQICSDLHLEHAPFAPPDARADLVVLAGDIDNGAAGIEWAKRTFRRPVICVAGNHEYYEGEFDSVQQAMRAAARQGAVELLDCSETVFGGARFLGCTLWTDYSLAPQAERPAVIEAARKLNPDYQLIRRGARLFSPEDAIALCTRHRAGLRFPPGQPRLRPRPHRNDGPRGAVDPRTHAHVLRLPRARHARGLQPTRLSRRADRVPPGPDRRAVTDIFL